MQKDHVDVLIVGAGISGIGMAVHLSEKCPNKSYTIIERRDDIGGTWSLFQYPGIRSDSDMHTLGYSFEPWTEQKSIADGPSIMKYLHRISDKNGLRDNMRFGHKVLSANWSSENAFWTVDIEKSDGSKIQVCANFLFMGSGYYDYDEPYNAQINGLSNFSGDVVHPQFWPKDLDYNNKKVTIIGSGATAVTIVPIMAQKAEHVTMLQRTPTWMFTTDSKDHLANFMRKIMPTKWAYKVTRFKNVVMQHITFRMARSRPKALIKKLEKPLKKELGHKYEPVHFTPPYGPWEQRLCLIPDGDFLKSIAAEKAHIVTDHIDHVQSDGILLKSGNKIESDVIVTATGLKLAIAGKVKFSVDGKDINFHDHYYYKGCMFSNIPNMTIVFGYLNASWTLKTDIVCEYTCRLLNHMDENTSSIVNPVLSDNAAIEEDELFDFSSGYIQRSISELPRNTTKMPWKLNQNYLEDRKILLKGAIDDGIIQFYGPNNVQREASLEAAE